MSVIEILIVIFIIVVALIALSGLTTFSLKVSSSIKESALADNLARETIEAVRNFRDGTAWAADGLGTLSVDSSHPHYPRLDTSTSPAKWTLPEGTETTSGFTRKVVFEKVSRNPANKNIEAVYNPANDDPNTRKAVITVSWKSKNFEVIVYFTNWKL